MTVMKVADEFSPDPGGRFIDDGEWSGELFRDSFLAARVKTAIEQGVTLEVDFDGVSGLPTSFAEEAFGGLVRKYTNWTADQLRATVRIIAPNSPKLWAYVNFAKEAMEKALRLRGVS